VGAEIAAPARPSGWRRQALSSWSDTRDPQFYGTFEVDAGPAERALAVASAHHGRRIALQHLVLKAVAATVAEHPEMNGTVRWGRAAPHAGLPLAQLTYVPDESAGGGLHKYLIADAHQKSLDEIAREDMLALLRIHRGRDPIRERRRRFLARVPSPCMGTVLRAIDFLTFACQRDLSPIGFPAGAQGAGIISTLPFAPASVAACFLPSSRAPFLLTVTPPRPRPVVREGAVVVRPILRLFGTFDNRLIDGYQACRFGDALARRLETPGSLLADEPFAAALDGDVAPVGRAGRR
jgi:hypothetical protein